MPEGRRGAVEEVGRGDCRTVVADFLRADLTGLLIGSRDGSAGFSNDANLTPLSLVDPG